MVGIEELAEDGRLPGWTSAEMRSQSFEASFPLADPTE